MLTRILVAAIALLTAVGVWRLARWYWRPRLRLPREPALIREQRGLRLSLEVHNEGAARSRRCRARLLRAERGEGDAWIRVEAPVHRAAATEAGTVGIPAHGSALLTVDRVLPTEAGRYRVEVAVIDGEEVRASYVIEVEGIDRVSSP